MAPDLQTRQTYTSRRQNWNGTVHFADSLGRLACGPVRTARCYLMPTASAATCRRCLKRVGSDSAGHADPPPAGDPHASRRALERAERQAARTPADGVPA